MSLFLFHRSWWLISDTVRNSKNSEFYKLPINSVLLRVINLAGLHVAKFQQKYLSIYDGFKILEIFLKVFFINLSIV